MIWKRREDPIKEVSHEEYANKRMDHLQEQHALLFHAIQGLAEQLGYEIEWRQSPSAIIRKATNGKIKGG